MKTTIKNTLGLGATAILILAACNNTTKTTDGKDSSKDTPQLHQLTNDKAAAKQQLYLGLSDEKETDSSKVYLAKALFDKDTVGVQVEVLKNIKPGLTSDGLIDEKAGFVKGSIKISSIGAASDNFVKALGSIFKSTDVKPMTTTVLLPTVYSSNKVDVDLSKQATYSFKLFFDNSKGEPAEVFAIVDTYRKSFEITEKDSTFRSQILSAFEGK